MSKLVRNCYCISFILLMASVSKAATCEELALELQDAERLELENRTIEAELEPLQQQIDAAEENLKLAKEKLKQELRKLGFRKVTDLTDDPEKAMQRINAKYDPTFAYNQLEAIKTAIKEKQRMEGHISSLRFLFLNKDLLVWTDKRSVDLIRMQMRATNCP